MTNLQTYNEDALVTLLKKGDENAFIELYNRYKLRILGNLIKLLRSEDLALEFSQELFMKIWDNRACLDPEKSFRSYIFRISENMVMDFFRKVVRDKKLHTRLMEIQTEIYSHIEEDINEAQESQLLREAIALLPPQRRQVFTLCKLEGKSYKEVSDHLLKANRFLKQQINPILLFAVSTIAMAVVEGV